MPKNDNTHVAYEDKKITIKSAPEKGESISVFSRPGDKISFDFDISKAQFKMVGADIIVRIPDEGEIIFVSLAILAFEENPPVIILPSGQLLDISSILLQVDEIKESKITSILSDDVVALESEL